MNDGDVGLCSDCMEATDGHLYHAACCGHDVVEDMDSGYGQVTAFCVDCGAALYLMPPDEPDDKAYWEVMA